MKRVRLLNRAVPILLVVFLTTSFAAIGYAMITTPLFDLGSSANPTLGYTSTSGFHQGILGKTNIANVSPLCILSGSKPSSGPNLDITSSNGKTLVVPLNWNLVNGCVLVSQFQVPLPPGTYSVTLSPCNYLGCRNLPFTVQVEPGTFAQVNINIVTGIY